jgi:hypothetical protein
MLYVIDNCDEYEDREIYFIEAPKSFGAWFETVLVPWQRTILAKIHPRQVWFKVHSLICVATDAQWLNDRRPQSVESYLAKNSFTSKIAPDVPLALYTPKEEP